MYNQYNEQNMYLSAKSIYAPKGFPQGGTFWALTKDFRDFILTGNKSNGENGYGGLFCTHWGYSIDDMLRIQNKAVELGYL